MAETTVHQTTLATLYKGWQDYQGALIAGPYGYTYLPARDGQPSRCVVNEAEAVVIRQMFAWLVEEQLSTAAVAKRLTAQRVPTRRGHVPWSPASVYKILNNRAYTGTHHYNRSRNAPEGPRAGATGRRPTKAPRRCLRPPQEWIAVPWAAIISEEVFALGQRQLQVNRERSPRKTKLRYLLSGLLYCGYCGRRLGGHAGVATGRYDCTRCRPTESPEQRCHLRAVNQRDIEPVVWGTREAELDERGQPAGAHGAQRPPGGAQEQSDDPLQPCCKPDRPLPL